MRHASILLHGRGIFTPFCGGCPGKSPGGCQSYAGPGSLGALGAARPGRAGRWTAANPTRRDLSHSTCSRRAIPRFVAALREVSDSAALAEFAATWFADGRPEARRLLFAYLDEPPNAPGHEGLVKRLFKLAEAAGNDEIMARFLVLGDRLIVSRPRSPSGGRSTRQSTLPRPDWQEGRTLASLTEEQQASLRWFAVATRRYLQRRAWRYCRALARTDPARYLTTATTALSLVRDSELGDGLALLDHSGLMRLLFAQCPALRFKSSGCDLAPGHTLAELAPSPAFPALWADHPEAVGRVLDQAQSRVVARWAVRWIEADCARFGTIGTVAGWVNLLDRADPEVVALALAMLADLGIDQAHQIPPEAWIEAIKRAEPTNQVVIADFVNQVFAPNDVSRADAVRLALSRDEPLARLGWRWVEGQGVATARPGTDPDSDARELLCLIDAGFAPLRPVILSTIHAGLAGRDPIPADWVWALLDSRHADARAEGWAWFRAAESLRADPGLWAKLVASPYSDVQAACATVPGLVPVEPERLESVWAAVLLRPDGVARLKPGVIRQVIGRIEAIATDPDRAAEVVDLIDLLASVVRSAHVPERRAALAALVGLAERHPAWVERIEAAVPALQIEPSPAILPA